MVILTAGWLVFYGLLYAHILPWVTGEPASEGAFTDFLLTFKGTDYPHLWYMFMIVGMYMMIPILRLFVKQKNKNYIIGIIVVSVIIQFICKLLDLTVIESAVNFTGFIGKFHLEPATGYIVYILAGWYLAHNKIGKKARIALYITSAAAVIASIFAVQYCISDISSIRDYCYEALTLTAFLYGCALFVLIKSLCGSRKTNRGAAFMSDMSFGIYMIHILYCELLTRKLMPYEAFGLKNSLAYIVIAFAIVCALSLVTVYAVSRTKYLKKIFYIR